MARRGKREPAARRRIGLTALSFYALGLLAAGFWLVVMKYVVIEDHARSLFSIFNDNYELPQIIDKKAILAQEFESGFQQLEVQKQALGKRPTATIPSGYMDVSDPEAYSDFQKRLIAQAETSTRHLRFQSYGEGEEDHGVTGAQAVYWLPSIRDRYHSRCEVPGDPISIPHCSYKDGEAQRDFLYAVPKATRPIDIFLSPFLFLKNEPDVYYDQLCIDIEGNYVRCSDTYKETIMQIAKATGFVNRSRAQAEVAAAQGSYDEKRAAIMKKLEQHIDDSAAQVNRELSKRPYQIEAVTFFAFSGLIAFAFWFLASMPRYGLIGGRTGVEPDGTPPDPAAFAKGAAVVLLVILVAGFGFKWAGENTELFDQSPILSGAWQSALVFVPAFLMILGPFAFLLISEMIKDLRVYRRIASFGKGGSARWAGVRTFIENDFSGFMRMNANHIYPDTRDAPIYLGRTPFENDLRLMGRDIGINTDAHMLTVGVPGSGKSRDVLHNNLLTWPHGLFTFDPKGEHVRRTYKRRSAYRHAHVLDPYGVVSDIVKSNVFNPLSEIDPAHPHALEDIQTLAEACVIEEHNQGEHFRENAITIYQGVIVHVLTTYPEEQRHLGTVFDIITIGGPEEDVYNPQAFASVLDAMRNNNAMGKLPVFAVGILDRVGDKERGSFFSTLARGIKWLATPAMRANIERSSFRLSGLKANKETLYVVLPHTRIKDQMRWMRILATMAINATVYTAPRKGCETHRTLFVFDEFYQLGKFDPVAKGLSILRQSKVKIWMFVQYLEQLEKLYGGLGDFENTCDRQFFGVEDAPTAEHINKLLGTYRFPYKEGQEGQSRFYDPVYDLRATNEIMEELEQDSPMQYVFPIRSKPLLLMKRPFYKNFDDSQYGDVPEHLHGGQEPAFTAAGA